MFIQFFAQSTELNSVESSYVAQWDQLVLLNEKHKWQQVS